MRIAVGNLKGGVAKTTTAVYLSLGLARTGRVLLVDADGTNASALDWSAHAADWPAGVVVVPWAVPDLGRRVAAVAGDYTHLVVDTGPERGDLLRQALAATDELLVPVAPSPMELRKLAATFAAAAEVDAVSPVVARVLLVKVQSSTRVASGGMRGGARAYLAGLGLPVMDAEVRLRPTAYPSSWGSGAVDLLDYEAVLAELVAGDGAGEGAA